MFFFFFLKEEWGQNTYEHRDSLGAPDSVGLLLSKKTFALSSVQELCSHEAELVHARQASRKVRGLDRSWHLEAISKRKVSQKWGWEVQKNAKTKAVALWVVLPSFIICNKQVTVRLTSRNRRIKDGLLRSVCPHLLKRKIEKCL